MENVNNNNNFGNNFNNNGNNFNNNGYNFNNNGYNNQKRKPFVNAIIEAQVESTPREASFRDKENNKEIKGYKVSIKPLNQKIPFIDEIWTDNNNYNTGDIIQINVTASAYKLKILK